MTGSDFEFGFVLGIACTLLGAIIFLAFVPVDTIIGWFL